MDPDDRRVGSLLTRREALAILGSAGFAILTGSTEALSAAKDVAPLPCVVRPELTEGPYFVDEMLRRPDIRSDPTDGSLREGVPLDLTIFVSRLAGGTCRRLPGALVDVWHCDALGIYSDVDDPGFDTVGKKFLRGCQVTDAEGMVRFTTIYPGWYPGRAVHIHFKIRSPAAAKPTYEFTSQLFFDDGLTDRVHAEKPYAAHGKGRRRNSRDGTFNEGGSQLLLEPTRTKQGYAARFDVALETS